MILNCSPGLSASKSCALLKSSQSFTSKKLGAKGGKIVLDFNFLLFLLGTLLPIPSI